MSSESHQTEEFPLPTTSLVLRQAPPELFPKVASAIDDAQPMFAQHLGRSNYVIHRQAAPADHNDRAIEVRYRAGQVAVSLPQQGKGQGF